ncbi:type II secretion system protein [Jeotgalibacillus sp. ET6]|uniref:type II secretion system protein n=1 Tax=Jeotgalibacillus sp. ET6 TaxID=3037260 RepID=UPI002418587D|nr:type II secretion system protein [Jeotgalibacillus sp. ET6]MDG5470954.1 type II secretion system protein [Jeotgalibacillus sp. ET6]
MRKENGFTLIEVLAVVVIAGILFSIGAAMMQTTIMISRHDSFLATAHSLEEAARQYSYHHQIGKKETERVTYSDLVGEGLFERVKDPYTGDFFEDDNTTFISYKNNEPLSICLKGYTHEICGDSNGEGLSFSLLSRDRIVRME